MLKHVGLIDIDLARSSGADGRLLRKLGGKTLLERAVRQVTDCQRLWRVAVLTTTAPANDPAAEAIPADVPVFRRPPSDSLARFAWAAEHYRADGLLRVSLQSPFVDSVLLDRLANTADEHGACDYICYCRGGERPTLQWPLGVVGEWCRSAAVQQAHRDAVDRAMRAEPFRYIAAHPEAFILRLLALPTELDRPDLWLRLDNEDDWDRAQAIYETLGPERLDWRQIVQLLEATPSLCPSQARARENVSAASAARYRPSPSMAPTDSAPGSDETPA